ncbi:hypothetical protein F183_A20270 [Bryobacterales bacterium F-183]|nr:hypothetical protein F183_A20270 [Bryobacterales bacterium F-183]
MNRVMFQFPYREPRIGHYLGCLALFLSVAVLLALGSRRSFLFGLATLWLYWPGVWVVAPLIPSDFRAQHQILFLVVCFAATVGCWVAFAWSAGVIIRLIWPVPEHTESTVADVDES